MTRRAHYADFYGDAPDTGRDRDQPVLAVLGNCQAESLRLMLDLPGVTTVRVPAIHELTAEDLPHLRRLLSRTELLVAQPVAADYRGLPLGTDQVVEHLPRDARVALVPSVRFAGLHPYHVLIHPPGLEEPPPLVAYHDLRVVSLALTGAGLDGAPGLAPLTPAMVEAVSAQSLAELRRREQAHGTVPVADLLTRPRFTDLRTINHPGNRVLSEVARRLGRALGLDSLGLGADVVDPGRPLLDVVHAPRHPVAVAVHDPEAVAESRWRVAGEWLEEEQVHRAHLDWYAEHPAVLAEAVRRHRGTLDLLGLPDGLGSAA